LFTWNWKTTIQVGAFGLVEAAMWALMEELPRWMKVSTILLGLVFIASLNVTTRRKSFRALPWVLGSSYFVLLAYALLVTPQTVDKILKFTTANQPWLVASLAGIGGLVIGFAVKRPGPLLPVIHSARWGTKTIAGMNVADILRKRLRKTLLLKAENPFLGVTPETDPAYREYKRLLIEYSYGSTDIARIEVPEYKTFVLPEDPWLKEQLEAFKNRPATTPILGVPPNAEDLIRQWRKMISDIQSTGASPPAALAAHPDYPSLRSHLSDATKEAIEGIQVPFGVDFHRTMPPLLINLLEVIERLAKTWSLPNALASLPDMIQEYPWPVFKATVSADDPVPKENALITFKNKIRFDIRNVTGKNVHTWTPVWKSDHVDYQAVSPGDPPGSRFRLRGKDGSWISERQDDDGKYKPIEYSCLELKPGALCDCYIGLDPRPEQSLQEMVRTGTYIGTAVFPLKIDGQLYVTSLRC